MSNNIIQEKSFSFSVRIIKLYKFLVNEKKDYILSKQNLRSATSIGANLEEALGGQSKKDFLSKLSISYKEARETHYWLRLLNESDMIMSEQFNSIITDCDESLKLLTQ